MRIYNKHLYIIVSVVSSERAATFLRNNPIAGNS